MSTSLIVSLLAERTSSELVRMQHKLEAERKKLSEEISRLNVEVKQVEEALARKARSRGRNAATGQKPSGGRPSTRERVEAFVKSAEGAVSPADTYAALRDDGYTGSLSGIYNAFPRLLKQGSVEKVGDGLYQAVSINGGYVDDELPRLPEIGTGERLSPATQSHEAARQDA